MAEKHRREQAVRQLTKKLQRGQAIDTGAMSAAAMRAFGGPEGLMDFVCSIAKDAEPGSIAQVTALRFVVDICKNSFQNDQELLRDEDTKDLEALLISVVNQADQDSGDAPESE